MTPAAALLQIQLCGGIIRGRATALHRPRTRYFFSRAAEEGMRISRLGAESALKGRSQKMSGLKNTHGAIPERSTVSSNTSNERRRSL
jgi:hypothetical protein